MGFVGAFAQEEGAFAEFQKGLAFFEVAINQAKAIAKALANSQSPTPDNIVTGGLAGLAKFATISSSILTTAAAAKKYIFSPPEAPTPRMLSTGAFLSGPKHSQGGMDVLSNGIKVMELEGNEAVFSSDTVANNYPVVEQLMNSSNNYGGVAISQIPQFNYSAMTGAAAASGSGQSSLSHVAKEFSRSVEAFNNAVANMPEMVSAYLNMDELEKEVLRRRKRIRKTESAKTIKDWRMSGYEALRRLNTEM